MRVLSVFFSWPEGGVWSNLLASFIWAAPTFGYALRKQHLHHRRVEQSLAALHKHLRTGHKEEDN